jgi:prepilin-type N-terminal cleavage/methylation domain-containing protein
MLFKSKTALRGFTLIELLVVIAILGILASIVMSALGESGLQGRDGARKAQIQELLKGLELYYSTSGVYPLYGAISDTGGDLSGINASFYGIGNSMVKLPDEAAARYYYCVSADQKSILIAVDTEEDRGGSAYCRVTRGPGPYGCNVWQAAFAADTCLSRF